MATRKGPADSATVHPVGTRKRGNDGRMWVVAETLSGVRWWVRAATPAAPRAAVPRSRAATPRPRAPAAPRRASAPPPPRPRAPAAPGAALANHRLLFCEPYSASPDAGNPRRRGLFRGVELLVQDGLYRAILRAPKKYRRKEGLDVGNAYVFGPRFPLPSYERLGDHGNDGAQTGFIDLDAFDPAAQQKVFEETIRAFTDGRRLLNWDDRPALRRLRAVIPHVVFIGETAGGDVGAELYAHKSRGAVDSLIIDNNYFFRAPAPTPAPAAGIRRRAPRPKKGKRAARRR